MQIDGSVRGFGAGAGNTRNEVFAAVADRLGITTGIDVLALMDAAEEVVRPVMDSECIIDRMALVMGYAGRVLQLLASTRSVPPSSTASAAPTC